MIWFYKPCYPGERSTDMKQVHRILAAVLTVVMVITLCGCSEKVKPEKINTKDYSRQIRMPCYRHSR